MKFVITNLQHARRSVPAPGNRSFDIGPDGTIVIDFPSQYAAFFEGLRDHGYRVSSSPSGLDRLLKPKGTSGTPSTVKPDTVPTKKPLPASLLNAKQPSATTPVVSQPIATDTVPINSDPPLPKVPALVELAKIDSIVKNTGVEFNNLGLPNSVKGRFDDSTERDVTINWASDSYTSGISGTYKITGTPDKSTEYDNPNNVTIDIVVKLVQPVDPANGSDATQVNQGTAVKSALTDKDVESLFDAIRRLSADQLHQICVKLNINTVSNKPGTLIAKIENSSASDKQIYDAYNEVVNSVNA